MKSLGFFPISGVSGYQGTFLMGHGFSSKDSFNRPLPYFKSVPDSTNTNTSYFGPPREAMSFPFKGKRHVVPSISGLSNKIYPTTIFRIVPLIIVDSIYLKTTDKRRFHISNEVVKTMPAIANLDSTPPVVGIVRVAGVVTPPQYTSPYVIKGVFPVTVLSNLLSVKAPAAFRRWSDFVLWFSEIAKSYAYRLITAITLTKSHFSARNTGKGENHKASKTLPNRNLALLHKHLLYVIRKHIMYCRLLQVVSCCFKREVPL